MFVNDLESWILYQATKAKRTTVFGSSNCSKISTYTVLKHPVSKGCKGNDTAYCVKSMELGIVVSFEILI